MVRTMIRTPIGKYDADILMSRTGLCRKPTRIGTRRVMVDGVVYPSVQVAATSIGALRTSLRKALVKGEPSFQGHEISYCKEE